MKLKTLVCFLFVLAFGFTAGNSSAPPIPEDDAQTILVDNVNSDDVQMTALQIDIETIDQLAEPSLFLPFDDPEEPQSCSFDEDNLRPPDLTYQKNQDLLLSKNIEEYHSVYGLSCRQLN